MTGTTPNLLLMVSFPLVCIALSVMADLGALALRRLRPAAFPGGGERLYWAVMIAALLKSAVFSLIFVPALALESRVVIAYPTTQLEMAVLMVLPALFGAFFATRLERHVFELLESGLMRDRQRFFALPRRMRTEAGQ